LGQESSAKCAKSQFASARRRTGRRIHGANSREMRGSRALFAVTLVFFLATFTIYGASDRNNEKLP
jgi:hypothetical protein